MRTETDTHDTNPFGASPSDSYLTLYCHCYNPNCRLVIHLEQSELDAEYGIVVMSFQADPVGLRGRLRCAWQILRGTAPLLSEVVMHEQDARRMYQALGDTIERCWAPHRVGLPGE